MFRDVDSRKLDNPFGLDRALGRPLLESPLPPGWRVQRWIQSEGTMKPPTIAVIG